jgi:hypothetical protein
MVSLARILRWEVGAAGEFERPRSPEEIIAKLERKVGPEGRRIFERFLRQVARLQEKQQREIMGEVEDERAEDAGGSEVFGDSHSEGGADDGNG